MIGKLDSKSHEVTVLGGGIAGLLIAYALDQKGYRVTLFESKARAGGLIRTSQTMEGIAESAAHSLLGTQEVMDLFKQLNVSLFAVNPESRARFILRNGKLRRFPLTLWESFKALLRAYFVLAPRDKSPESMTLSEWGNRFLGRAAVQYLLSPMIRGIFAVSPDQLIIGAAFPKWQIPRGHSFLSFQLERFRKGLFKKKKNGIRPKMMAPGAGMEEVIRALEKNLREKLGDRFKLGTEIRELPTGKNIVLAVPADSAAKLLAQQDPELSNALKLIRYVPLVSVTVFVRKEYLLNIPKGVGVLFPEEENMNCLGILFNSSAFPSRVNDVNQVISLTALLGGSENSQALKLSDSEVIQKIECDVNQVFGLRGKISSYQIHRWEKAIPIYDQTLIDTWSVAKRGWGSISGHVLFGNYTGQVSIRGMIETLFHQESDKIIRVE